ncbi:THO complex subunit 6 homolog [Amphiura filiformis]|uniref:THO complex subunit 6 homolog n=1 Tax=Amphiura filiformis TaxID=82378 RepID=UPI003B22580D
MSLTTNYQEEILKQRQQLHMTVFAQCISPDGKYLLAGNSYGTIAVYSLNAALSPDANEAALKPIFTFKAYDGAIYALTTTEKFLISAGLGEIKAWNWSEIIKKDNVLYSGGGDNHMYAWDLETGTCTNTFQGHQDYIHSVALFNQSQQIVSASEDGSVRIWDPRNEGEAVGILEPYKHEECKRSQLGKWVSCVAVDSGDDWLVCGGGPSLSLWHLRSLSPTVTFDTPNTCPQIVTFHDSSIISGGNSASIDHWNINGDLKTRVPCTSSSVFSIVINTASQHNRVLSAAGTSANIDIYTNFGYKAFSLQFC